MSAFRPDDPFDDTLRAFLDDEASRAENAPGMATAEIVSGRVARRIDRPSHAHRSLVVAGFAVVLVAAGAWLATSIRTVDPRPAGLLAEIQARGSARIAVRPDFPQSTTAGLGGFDLDVANELGRRLGIRAELMIRAPEQMLRPVDAAIVDLALPSDARLGPDGTTISASDPYYHWPVFVAVADASPVTAVSGLAGQAVCVREGSATADWILGAYAGPSSTPVLAPPDDVIVRREALDRDCLDALLAGEVDALATSTLSATDLSARPVRTLGGAVFTEPRSVVAQRAGGDPAGLIAEVDRVLSEMRTDGTLVGFSQNRFGGRDLTVPPIPEGA